MANVTLVLLFLAVIFFGPMIISTILDGMIGIYSRIKNDRLERREREIEIKLKEEKLKFAEMQTINEQLQTPYQRKKDEQKTS